MKVKDVVLLGACGAAALFAYDRYQARAAAAVGREAASAARAVPASAVEDRSWITTRDASPGTAAPSAAASRCDGRTRCPQMTSCAEATYFLQQCPDTAMDGDGDGIPYEGQWCR